MRKYVVPYNSDKFYFSCNNMYISYVVIIIDVTCIDEMKIERAGVEGDSGRRKQLTSS